MTYAEATEYLFAQVPMFQNMGSGAYKPGLDTTLAIARHHGNPHEHLKSCIHVGGTNGKGSTAHTLAAVLQSAGYKVGLYTSPHLVDFRERIRIDGEPVSEDFVTDFVEDFIASDDLQGLHPTFFELTTILAFKWFVKQQVDVAVIEVGLGGRLDCTNIISPVLSIITNISLDHTAQLGHTEAEIAVEKAGIIKHGVPAVIGRAEPGSDVRKVFADRAAEVGAPITFACDRLRFRPEHADGKTIYADSPFGTIVPELTGSCQIENANTIITALELLQPVFDRIRDKDVQEGFAHVCELTSFAGRWMTLSTQPVQLVCDTGHNIGGWRYLGPTLTEEAKHRKVHMVLGFVNDKDVSAIMDTMPRAAVYYYATPSVRRGRPAEETADEGRRHGLNGSAYPTVEDAYKAAMATAIEGDLVFVGGSTFVVADLLLSLQKARG